MTRQKKYMQEKIDEYSDQMEAEISMGDLPKKTVDNMQQRLGDMQDQLAALSGFKSYFDMIETESTKQQAAVH